MASLSIAAQGITVVLDLSVGHIADFAVESDGRVLRPLHRAPWIEEPDAPQDIAAGLARLSGDFLCAPFSRSDVEDAPGHGWPANSSWTVTASAATPDGWQAELRLDRSVMGATIEKALILRDGHPFLYQRHRLVGGHGELPVAHHVMGSMSNGGRLAFSPKRFAETPDQPLEPDPARGRYLFAYPARVENLAVFPTRDGAVTDLAIYRDADRREDFIVLAEADHGGPGWTALARAAEQDLLLVLKNPEELPVTMLWFSNGGRDYAPWNGRHLGVLGIEDGRTAVGHRASIGDNSLKRAGIPTAFTLDRKKPVTFRQVIGAVADTSGAPPVKLAPGDGALTMTFGDGRQMSVPFDTSFL